MPRRALILRYSNEEVEEPGNGTVQRHINSSGADGKVWWGWWKKKSEPFDPEILQLAAREVESGRLTVGLLNRKEQEYWTATCSAVYFQEDGSMSLVPAEGPVPGYYGTDEFPAWFELGEFRQIDLGEFRRLFGAPPSSDPTLYLVTESDRGEVAIRPMPEWSMTPRSARAARILHLSDLHFGADHNYPIRRPEPPGRVEQQLLLDIVTEYLDRAAIEIGIVLVSGDLITAVGSSNYPDAFSDARTFLTNLCERLGLDHHNVVIVPGNHDIPLQEFEHPTREYEHEGPYRDFLRSYYLEECRELERVHRFETDDGWDLVVVALNSVRLRSRDMMEYGYVGAHRYVDMLKYVENALKQKSERTREAKIVLLHHHLLPVTALDIPEPKRPVSLTLDAGELLEQMQLNKVRLALHGHQHAPFLARTSRAYYSPDGWQPPADDVIILGMGSTGAKRLPPDTPWNYFGIYELLDSGIDVNLVSFLPGRTPAPQFSTHLAW